MQFHMKIMDSTQVKEKTQKDPAGLPATILQLTGRLQDKSCAVPCCRTLNGHGGGSRPRALDIYTHVHTCAYMIYIYTYAHICLYIHIH